MRPSAAFEIHRDAIRAIVLSHRAVNARIFGSVARGEDHEGSDLDVLVDPTASTSIIDIGLIQHELHALLGVDVDVLTPKAIAADFRDKVLAEAINV